MTPAEEMASPEESLSTCSSTYQYPYNQPALLSVHRINRVITENFHTKTRIDRSEWCFEGSSHEPGKRIGKQASKKPADSATPKTTELAASYPHDAAGGINIDFHSAEFNRTDDLNDYSGNYRSFQSLDGVVTADMRHQMERRRNRDALDSCIDDAAPVKNIETRNDGAAGRRNRAPANRDLQRANLDRRSRTPNAPSPAANSSAIKD